MKKCYTRIDALAGNVASLTAPGVSYEELAVVEGRGGRSLAQVIRLRGDEVSLQVFAGTRGVGTGDRVTLLGAPMRFSFTEALLGRVFDGAGEPRDGRSPLAENLTIAHVLRVWGRPLQLSLLAEGGWVLFIWAMLALVNTLVLGSPRPPWDWSSCSLRPPATR